MLVIINYSLQRHVVLTDKTSVKDVNPSFQTQAASNYSQLKQISLSLCILDFHLLDMVSLIEFLSQKAVGNSSEIMLQELYIACLECSLHEM